MHCSPVRYIICKSIEFVNKRLENISLGAIKNLSSNTKKNNYYPKDTDTFSFRSLRDYIIYIQSRLTWNRSILAIIIVLD